jgi:hypothetical protein
MTLRHPPADVIWQTDITIVAARQGGQIDRLPTAIVGINVRPVWVVAGMKSPGSIEQGGGGSRRWRSGAAGTRQVGYYGSDKDQRRKDNAGHQFALGCVDRNPRRRY